MLDREDDLSLTLVNLDYERSVYPRSLSDSSDAIYTHECTIDASLRIEYSSSSDRSLDSWSKVTMKLFLFATLTVAVVSAKESSESKTLDYIDGPDYDDNSISYDEYGWTCEVYDCKKAEWLCEPDQRSCWCWCLAHDFLKSDACPELPKIECNNDIGSNRVPTESSEQQFNKTKFCEPGTIRRRDYGGCTCENDGLGEVCAAMAGRNEIFGILIFGSIVVSLFSSS